MCSGNTMGIPHLKIKCKFNKVTFVPTDQIIYQLSVYLYTCGSSGSGEKRKGIFLSTTNNKQHR